MNLQAQMNMRMPKARELKVLKLKPTVILGNLDFHVELQ